MCGRGALPPVLFLATPMVLAISNDVLCLATELAQLAGDEAGATIRVMRWVVVGNSIGVVVGGRCSRGRV